MCWNTGQHGVQRRSLPTDQQQQAACVCGYFCSSGPDCRITFHAIEHHRLLAITKLYCLVTEAHVCEQLAHDCYMKVQSNPWPWSRVQRSDRYTITIGWLSGRTSVSNRRTFTGLHRACSWWVTIYMGKPSAVGRPTRPTQPFILTGSINE